MMCVPDGEVAEQTMKQLECFECGSPVEPRIEERVETLPVRGEDTQVLARVAVCPRCGADMSVEELDDATLVAAFNLYRQRHGLMTPEEMRGLRERYGLGVRPFSLLLGWGEITLHRYEAGSLQDAAHEVTLRLAENPANLRVLLTSNGHKLTARQRARLESRLSAIEVDELGLIRSWLVQETAARYIAGGHGDREGERRRLRIESAASRMRAIGERFGLTGDAVQIVAETRATEDPRHE